MEEDINYSNTSKSTSPTMKTKKHNIKVLTTPKSDPDSSAMSQTYSSNSPTSQSQMSLEKENIPTYEDRFLDAQNVFSFLTTNSNPLLRIKVQGKMKDDDIRKLCLGEFPTRFASIDWTNCEGISPFFPQLVRLYWDQSLTSFDVSEGEVKDPVFIYLPQALSLNRTLTTLNIHLKGTHEKQLITIFATLVSHCTLRSLNLRSTWLCGSGDMIGNLLTRNSTLTGLDLTGTQINESCMEHIGKALNQKLIEYSDSTKSFQLINQPQFIRILNLSNNNISDKGAEHVGIILSSNTVLTELDVSQNNIGFDGARYIAEGLATNEALKILYLGKNLIDTQSTINIIGALQHISMLTMLDLDACNISVEGAQITVTIKGKKETVKTFISGNKTNKDVLRFTSDSLTPNTILSPRKRSQSTYKELL